MDTSALPTEIWQQIVEDISMPALFDFALISRQFWQVCARRIAEEQQRLQEMYRCYSPYDDYDNTNYFLLHDLLFRIMRREISPSYIIELKCQDECHNDVRRIWRSPHGLKPGLRNMQQEAMKLRSRITSAVRDSPWIEATEKDDYVQGICDGNEDQVLALLVPLLTNLKHLRPPINAEALGKILSRIARASATSLETPGYASTTATYPLSKLRLITTGASNGQEIGMHFDEVSPYIALPSVRTLFLINGRTLGAGHYKGWPATLPLSRVSEVFLSQSSIIPSEALAFAKGFHGPCVIRQSWRTYPGDEPDAGRDAQWDHIEIRVDESGARSEVIDLRYPDIDDYDYWSHWNELPRPSSARSDGMNDLMCDEVRLLNRAMQVVE